VTALADARRRLRAQAEHHLRLAAMEDLRRAHPQGTTTPYVDPHGELLWQRVFVPLYRRIPWEARQRAMRVLGMTAEARGWTRDARRAGQPWRPPAPR
jgi:hypothetical protein